MSVAGRPAAERSGALESLAAHAPGPEEVMAWCEPARVAVRPPAIVQEHAVLITAPRNVIVSLAAPLDES